MTKSRSIASTKREQAADAASVSTDGDLYIAGPPSYENSVGDVEVHQRDFDAKASIADDGRINIDITHRFSSQTDRLINQWLGENGAADGKPPSYTPQELEDDAVSGQYNVPAMNVVMHAVGCWEEVRPLIEIATTLQCAYGHRVRMATYPVFQPYVEQHGIEFFSIGGHPSEFMNRNSGAAPSMNTLINGDICQKRAAVTRILQACWESCIEPTTNEGRGFVADAIIATPSSFAHIHCAERLGIPLHLMSTLPWTPTQAFPHPMATIKSSNASSTLSHVMSFNLVEMMVWQGAGDVVSRFRKEKLGLEPIDRMFVSGLANRLKIPITYLWSSALLSKPNDWGHHISLSGCFTQPAIPNFAPDTSLAYFIEAGDPPIYIDFGSMEIQDPQSITYLLIEAIDRAGVRAVIARGQSNLGNRVSYTPETVIFVDDVPSDWIFNYVSCVILPGDAETTSKSLRFGKPVVTVPFFGDQFFWGDVVSKRGAGPVPIPYTGLSGERLSIAITQALQPEMQAVAEGISQSIGNEDGAAMAAKGFHSTLGMDSLRCSFAPRKAAVWNLKKQNIPLSPFAATVLCYEGVISPDELELLRHREYETDPGPIEPISGLMSATFETIGEIVMGVTDMPREAIRQIKLQNNRSNSTRKSWPIEKGTDVEERPSAKNNLPNACSQVALSTGKGVARIVGAGLKAPGIMTYELARGFHNMPHLYGDTTVRKMEPVTGMRSGFSNAGKGLAFGLYDGISGFFVQPFQGAQEDGAKGFVRGFGKGIGGLVCKPTAGACGLTGYALVGIQKQFSRNHSKSADLSSYLVVSRIAEGEEEWSHSSEKERLDIIGQWNFIEMQREANDQYDQPMPIYVA